MTFDYTLGKTAKYMVSLYSWSVHDKAYYHYFKDAKERFNRLANSPHKKGTCISLYDVVKDVRKDFKKF